MKLKSTVVAGVLSASMAVPVFANEAVATPLLQFTAHDAQMLFEQDAKPMQLTALSSQEMKETEGAFGFGGAAFGFGLYGAQTAYSSWNRNQSFSSNLHNTANNWSWRNAGLSAAGGFVSGGFSNAMLRGAGYTTFRSQWTAPIATQAVIRGNGFALGQTSFGLHRR